MEYNCNDMYCENIQCPYIQSLMQMRTMEMMPQIQSTPMIIDDEIDEETERYDESERQLDAKYQNEADQILRKIQRNNPAIFQMFKRFGVPYPVAVRLCRRIIVLTLMYGKC